MNEQRGTVKPNGTARDRRLDYWRQVGVIPRWQLVLVYMLIVGATGYGLLRTRDVAEEARAAATQARLAVDGVQRSRVDVCRDANQRHDDTLVVLESQIRKLPPARRARAEANKPGTVALINALAPKRDCQKLLEPKTG